MSDVEAQGALPTSSPPGLARVPIVPSGGGVLVGRAPCWFDVRHCPQTGSGSAAAAASFRGIGAVAHPPRLALVQLAQPGPQLRLVRPNTKPWV